MTTQLSWATEKETNINTNNASIIVTALLAVGEQAVENCYLLSSCAIQESLCNGDKRYNPES